MPPSRPPASDFPPLRPGLQGRGAEAWPPSSRWTSSGSSSPTSWASTRTSRCPKSQFEKALDGEIMFDGSSIEGFVRIEESDMLLVPDLRDLPAPAVGRRGRAGRAPHLRHLHSRTTRPFAGCPRLTLKRTIGKAGGAGLHADGGLRGGVLPLREGRRRQSDHDDPRRRHRTSI